MKLLPVFQGHFVLLFADVEFVWREISDHSSFFGKLVEFLEGVSAQDSSASYLRKDSGFPVKDESRREG